MGTIVSGRRRQDPEADERARLLGARLRSIRQAQELSQREIARRAGIEASYLNRLERGMHASPSADVLGRIAGALGIDAEILVHRASPGEPDRFLIGTAERFEASPKNRALWSLVGWFREQVEILDDADEESVVFVPPRGGVVKRE
jgi:transcriptional regulator with XRE-family HTH domain